MRGAIPPLPSTPSWRDAQLKAQGQPYVIAKHPNTDTTVDSHNLCLCISLNVYSVGNCFK
jgi:hypothetical protein